MFKKKQTPRRLGGEKTVKNIQFLALSIPTILIRSEEHTSDSSHGIGSRMPSSA